MHKNQDFPHNKYVMTMKKKELLELLLNATCTFTCTSYIKNILLKENFEEVKETEIWHLKEGKYFVTRNDASLIAFNIPKKATHFQIITTHNDTPSLLLKPKGENISENYLSVNVMPYGGLLNYGWLDHPLSIAGRIYIKKNNKIKKKIIDLKETLAVVPSVAIHLNDKANSNLDLNMQTDLQPILGISEKALDFEKFLNKKLNLSQDEKLIDYDLFLYNNEKPSFFGINDELLLSPRIDNITSVSASFYAFLNATSLEHINIFCTFNHEEIGSLTKEGAESDFLIDTLKRIGASLNMDIASSLAKSFIISSDNTHAVHPNHTEYKDKTGNVYLNKGFAIIKEVSSTTDASFSSLLKNLCEEKKISYQNATLKNDLTGGSTLSSLSLRQVSVNSIDVGIGELAMHSSLEVCSFKDYEALYNMMKCFYNTSLKEII